MAEAARQSARGPVDLMTGEEEERRRGQEPPTYFSIYDIAGNLVAAVDPGSVPLEIQRMHITLYFPRDPRHFMSKLTENATRHVLCQMS